METPEVLHLLLAARDWQRGPELRIRCPLPEILNRNKKRAVPPGTTLFRLFIHFFLNIGHECVQQWESVFQDADYYNHAPGCINDIHLAFRFRGTKNA